MFGLGKPREEIPAIELTNSETAPVVDVDAAFAQISREADEAHTQWKQSGGKEDKKATDQFFETIQALKNRLELLKLADAKPQEADDQPTLESMHQ